MPNLTDELRALSTPPARQGGGFDEWIQQNDTRSFLHKNSKAREIIIYASLPHVFLETVIIPARDFSKPSELREWELIHDRWGLNYSFNEPRVWLEPPFASERIDAFKNAEKLLFTRSFTGYEDDKNYFEILQKFAHTIDLHYIGHKNAWCRLDENGDIEEVLRILKFPNKAGLDTEYVATVLRSVLDEYLLASQAIAIRAFDFTRVDDSFHAWGGEREQTDYEDADFAYRLTIESGVGSYLRGVQILHPLTTMAQFHGGLINPEAERKYATFIAHDWKNCVVEEISCAPGATANYFTESSLPFEVTPAFFRAEVLSKYKANPEKYTVDERSITCRGSWNLKTYDINDEGQVHTYLVYLRNLPYSEQLYWKSFNETPKGPISRRALKTDFEGKFDFAYNPLQKLISLSRKLKASRVPWWKLIAENLLSKVHYPATSDSEEWANEIMTLDQLLVEGFEESWLRRKASELGQNVQERDKSLGLIECCLRGFGVEANSAKAAVAPLRTLHNLRSKMKGHAGGSDARELRQRALDEHGSYRDHFRNLCAECDVAMRRITEAFGAEG